jgi:hypothetical protein
MNSIRLRHLFAYLLLPAVPPTYSRAFHQIPLFALWKIYSVFLKPYFFSGSQGPSEDEDSSAQGTSKRQQKLKKRADKGDPRVKAR